MTAPRNFALVGAAGYVAPRHLRAIHETGGRLIAALDPHDAVGILDDYSLETHYFQEPERFDRFLDRSRRGSSLEHLHYLSVCSPNHLHDAHCRLGLRVGVDVICEKPLVINPWNLDALQRIEEETHHRIFCVLQLRLHPAVLALRERLQQEEERVHQIELDYLTPRGPWYDRAWKGSEEKSGGILANIGIHLFDLLLWLFGPCHGFTLQERSPRHASGTLSLTRAQVRWRLSVRSSDLLSVLPSPPGERHAPFRRLQVDGIPLDLSEGFQELHTRVYQEILEGRGLSSEKARPAIELVHALRSYGE